MMNGVRGRKLVVARLMGWDVLYILYAVHVSAIDRAHMDLPGHEG